VLPSALNKYNFVLAFPSADRPHGSTFDLIREAGLIIPTYVYVRSFQYDEYIKSQGDICEIIKIPNDNMTICELRRFIQDHQYQLGNNLFMLDDDIICFEKYIEQKGSDCRTNICSIVEVCDVVDKESLKGYDIVHLIMWTKTNKRQYSVDPDFLPILANAVFVSKTAYDKGLKYDEKAWSEDTTFSILSYVNELICSKVLMYFVHIDPDYTDTHFSLEWRVEAMLDAYLTYGTCVRTLFCDPLYYYVIISALGINSYMRNGLTYSKKLDSVLKGIMDDPTKLGHKYLCDRNWKSTGPFFEDLIY